MKTGDITYALFGGSGQRKCLAEVFCESVLGGDCCIFAEEFCGSVRRKKPRKNNYVTGGVLSTLVS